MSFSFYKNIQNGELTVFCSFHTTQNNCGKQPDNGVLAAGIPLEVSLSLKQCKKNNLAGAHADTGPTLHRLQMQPSPWPTPRPHRLDNVLRESRKNHHGGADRRVTPGLTGVGLSNFKSWKVLFGY
ncbi:unnamed protein product [Pleuronectes platessa]|uniref:Uncharacterized protein n=1 Tax=Pleuronectes platessa TaxID=8262 RepID=A0A9N7UHS2_PLEPL|nr:unnamed protein product [Pleuronectes platessa]